MVDFKYYLNRQGVRGQRGEKGDTGYSPVITEKTNTSTEYVLHIQNETDETSFDTVNLKEGLIPDDLGGTIVRYNRETGKQYYGEIDNATEDVAGVVKLEPELTTLNPASETSVLTAQAAVDHYASLTGNNSFTGSNVFIKDISVKSITGNDPDGFTIVQNSESKIVLTDNAVSIGRNTLPLILNGTTVTKNGDEVLSVADVDGETIEIQDGKLHVIDGGTDIDTYVVSTTMDTDCSALTVSSIQEGVTNEVQYQLGNVYAKKSDAVQYNVETEMGSDTVKELKVTGTAANLKLTALGTNASSDKEASIELQSVNTSATGVNGVFIKTSALASDKSAGVVGLYLGGETTPVCLAGEGGNFKILPDPKTSRAMGLEIGDDSLVFRKSDNSTVDLLTGGGGGTTLVAGDNITLEELSDGSTKISATGKLSVDVIDGGDSTTVNPLVTLANSSGNVIAQYNGETKGGEYNDIA